MIIKASLTFPMVLCIHIMFVTMLFIGYLSYPAQLMGRTIEMILHDPTIIYSEIEVEDDEFIIKVHRGTVEK